jgi:hypothetical protein
MGVLAQVENGDQFWKLKFHATNEKAQHALRALLFLFFCFWVTHQKWWVNFLLWYKHGWWWYFGDPTGVGLLVWVSDLVLVSFFSFSFHSIENCPNTTANMFSSYIVLYKSQKDLERLPNAHSFNLSQQPRAFSNTTHEIIRNSKPKMPKYHHLFGEFRWEKTNCSNLDPQFFCPNLDRQIFKSTWLIINIYA